MLIKIGNVRIDTRSRASKHREYLWNQIYSLRQEIVEIVDQLKALKDVTAHDFDGLSALLDEDE